MKHLTKTLTQDKNFFEVVVTNQFDYYFLKLRFLNSNKKIRGN